MSAVVQLLSATKRDSAVLPPLLQQVLPSCAQGCVTAYVEANFIPSACSNSTDVSLSCLCSHYSASGFTIGETSLACLNANCPQAILDQSSSQVYKVCSNISAAVSATHSILTLTTFPTKTTIMVSETRTATSSLSSRTTSLFSQTQSPSSTQTQTSSTESSISATSAGHSSSTSAILAPTSMKTANSLTTAQVAGISVAAFAGLGLIIGIIFLIACCRRKRKSTQKRCDRPSDSARHSYDFVDRSPILRPPKPARLEQGTVIYPHHFNQTCAFYPAQTSKDPHLSEDFFAAHFATAPDSNDRPLRPDLPTNRRTSKRVRPGSAATALTVFEEDAGPHDSSFLPKVPLSPAVPPQIITSARSGPGLTSHGLAAVREMGHRGLFIKIPGKSPTTLSPNAPVTLPPNSAMSYLPSYYMSNDSRTPTVPEFSNGISSQPKVASSHAPKTIRQSFASETSFESVDPDEATPPEEEDKQLSPVTESPISGIRYPKISRSTNQAVPRSSFQLSPSRASSLNTPASKKKATLIAKRRGDNVAKDLERGFFLHDSSRKDSLDARRSSPQKEGTEYKRRAGSPLERYGTGVRNGSKTYQDDMMDIKAPQMTPKSPWELTPSRRGDRLFISVQ